MAQPKVIVEDIFGRELNDHGITLVDWEGYVANPAIRLFLTPPSEIQYPARVQLHIPESRCYFDPSLDKPAIAEVGLFGPTKILRFFHPQRVPFYLGLWPDREAKDRDFPLEISVSDSAGRFFSTTIRIHVIDQDKPVEAPNFPMHVDFSKDETGYFSDVQRQAPIRRAALDWAYFFDGADFEETRKGEELTEVNGPDGWDHPKDVANERTYRGFWLYVLGNYRSTGGWAAARENQFQSQKGNQLPLRRSGAIGIETKPAGALDGYLLSFGDWEWWRFLYRSGSPVELYSLAQHEIGHALFADIHYPKFKTWEHWPGSIQDQAVFDYQKEYPEIGAGGHLIGSVDRISRLPAYGSATSLMHQRRWIVTKLDLLVAQAVGHRLRATSAFAPLTLQSEERLFSKTGTHFEYRPAAAGGVPFYYWSVTSGALPPGITLNSFDGTLSGTSQVSGIYRFGLTVRDYDEFGVSVTQEVTLTLSSIP